MEKIFSETDEKYMEMVLKLAKKAYNPSPNPYVGAVLVKNDKVVGSGYHEFAGGSHAEINAIKDAGRRSKGSTLYSNLEPCSHYGRTPPCTDAIIQAGIKKAIIAMKDPNPFVNGKGIGFLLKNGIRVKMGLKEEESKEINEFYIKFITKKMPFVIIKSAISIDGKIATSGNESRWISGDISRKYVHEKIRSKVDAILVGVGTVLADDPGLSIKVNKLTSQQVKIPFKIIVDSKLRIPVKAKVFKKPELVILATTKDAPKKKIEYFRKLGTTVLVVADKRDGRVDLKTLMKKLAEMEISSVLIEGGGEINASAISAGIADKFIFFIAPKIIGGRTAKTSVEGEGIKKLKDFIKIKKMKFMPIGPDIMVEGYF